MIKNMSQSLFYWKTPCNWNKYIKSINNVLVTILVLLENSLQSHLKELNGGGNNCHNPCFIGKLLAIEKSQEHKKQSIVSQSLFYWKTPCNKCILLVWDVMNVVTILVLLENSLQFHFIVHTKIRIVVTILVLLENSLQ